MNDVTTMRLRFERIKPIRGRSQDLRPIDNRRKQYQIIRKDAVDGAICARLHNTDVVRYYPDGTVGIQCNGWITPTTCDFMHRWSPAGCGAIRRKNRLWVRIRHVVSKPCIWAPVPLFGELKLAPTGTGGTWEVVSGAPQVSILTRNRKAVQEARAPAKPFLKWVKSILAISDGMLRISAEPVYRTPRLLEHLGDVTAYPDLLRIAVAFSGCILRFREDHAYVRYDTLKAYVHKELETPYGDSLYNKTVWTLGDKLPTGRVRIED